jgi:ubiquinol oxidase
MRETIVLVDHRPNLAGTPLAGADLHEAAAEQRRRPKRSYGVAAKFLFLALDAVYGRESTLEKFRVLEVVARVPYQAWEQVAFVAVTHTHTDPSFARSVHHRAQEARGQQDNELMHLLMIEELLDRQGFRRSLLRGVVIPQVLAFVYYQLSWLLYVVRPRWSYALNADFEDHATHTYLDFFADHPQLDQDPWQSQFADDYGPSPTVGDLFRRIALDESAHRDESERRIHAARFGEAPGEPITD